MCSDQSYHRWTSANEQMWFSSRTLVSFSWGCRKLIRFCRTKSNLHTCGSNQSFWTKSSKKDFKLILEPMVQKININWQLKEAGLGFNAPFFMWSSNGGLEAVTPVSPPLIKHKTWRVLNLDPAGGLLSRVNWNKLCLCVLLMQSFRRASMGAGWSTMVNLTAVTTVLRATGEPAGQQGQPWASLQLMRGNQKNKQSCRFILLLVAQI